MIRTAEFFAGMGLMRAGLERAGIRTVFANDIDKTKAALYRDNWGNDILHVGDIRNLSGDDIPPVGLATASFPCVDLSLAGHRQGLRGPQSSLVFEFLRILNEMENRAPGTVLIENVPGFMSANGGKDWQTVITHLEVLGYKVNHISVNANAFVPQSRERIFIIAYHGTDITFPTPPSPRDNMRLAEIADEGAEWWPASRLDALLNTLSPIQSERVAAYQAQQQISYFGAFRRTRKGHPVWEVRADEIAGALRTTRGGSAKQAILRAGRGSLAARWMNVMEYARLQGAENLRYESVSPQQAMFALGDAVCVPVIEWIANNCLQPLLSR